MSQKAVEAVAFKTGLAAGYVGISRRALTDLSAAGLIPYSRISSRLFLYRRKDLDAFLDNHRVGGVA